MTMSAAATAGSGVMDRLKAETAGHHARAEGKALQQALVRGQLPVEGYRAWLGQMYLVHLALERAIESSRAGSPLLTVVGDDHRHSARIADDLAHYGADAGAVTPLAATRKMIGLIERADAATLLGMHYVLEGSMNGNRYIAHAVRKAYGLTPGQGDRYLDPYGERQRAVWVAWRSAADACAWDGRSADAAVEGAKAMFDAVGEISDELAPSAG